MPVHVLAGLFFLSGAATLGYEIIWAHELSLIFGGTTVGVAYVTALFMGGISIGGVLGSHLVPRIRRPVLAYGWIEGALALLAVVAVVLLPSLRWVQSAVLAHLGAALLVLPCTILMGTTLPVLAEAVGGRLGVALGWLYGMNTLGAVAGVIVTGLVAVGALGLRGAGFALAGLGLVVAALAVVGGRDVPRAVRPADQARAKTRPAWLLAAFAAGFAGLAAEVLWTRALITELNASTYAFSLILAVFLAGLALGAAAAGRALARGWDPLRMTAITQLLCAVLVVFAPELLRLAEAAIPGYVGVRRATGLDVWLGTVGVGLARTTVAVLPVTFLLGWSFPLLCHVYAGAERGTAVGYFLATNTAGAVLGALAAHFLLLPHLGTGRGFQFTGVLLTFVGGAALFASDRRWAVVCAVPLAVVLLRPPAPPFLGRAVAPHHVLMVDEGVQDTTAVVELDAGGQRGARHIFSNGIAYAGNGAAARRYMYLLGHLPALAARGRARALVICAGTGQTVSAVARHDFARVDLVDISPVVQRTLPFFETTNDGVLNNPRVELHIEDGRRFIAAAAPGTYDVVTLEPPPPRAASVASLYSTDFYTRVASLLADGGAAAQWLPLHGMTGAELDMLTRSFSDVFPEGRFILLNPDEGALLAVRGEGATEAQYAERLMIPAVRAQLASIGVPDPRTLPSAGALGRRVGAGVTVTDDRPRIEHFAADLEWSTPASEREVLRAFLHRMLAPLQR